MTSPETRHSSGTLRVALIGCGKMGLQHLRAMRALSEATVVGVADPFADRESLATLLPAGAKVVNSTEELLTSVKPDVVHIVTPPGSHATLALQAIEAGCHVYIEKPFTPTLREAQEIFNLAAKRGVKVCAGHQVLFEHPALMARERMREIGRVVHVESYFSFRMVRRTITPAAQAKDILPHAIYPLVEQMRQATGLQDAPFEIRGLDVRADGDVYAMIKLGDCTGLATVTLSGRPIEQYQHLVGTNGWMRADYVTGSLTCLLGPGTGPGVLFTPYRRSFQTITGATKGFAKLIFGHKSYPGLETLSHRFYRSILDNTAPPLSPRSILDTVELCEQIDGELDRAEQESAAVAAGALAKAEAMLPPIDPARGAVLVTGGTGLLGARLAEELRHAGFRVLALARREPRAAVRVAGVEYVSGDLARGLDADLLKDVRVIAHCAAETAGGKEDHQRNSIAATENVLRSAAAAGVRNVINVSSLAVLKPGGDIDERTPLDVNLERGPYVWGKAQAEVVAQKLGQELGINVKVVRPGPLVDYAIYHPPGRLGRELGPYFVAIGGKRSALSVCDVGTAARVMRSYAEDFDSAPPVVNLVEVPPPTRLELASRLKQDRPDLKFFWFPALLLRMLSGPLKLVQRVAMGSDKPIDIYASFSSEKYVTTVAGGVIAKAGPSAIKQRG